GETIGNSNYSGGGGGGSGGAIILQAAGDVTIEADSNHLTPGFTDSTGAEGAALDVSGGQGCDANDNPKDTTNGPSPTAPGFGTFSRSDGGQGGFGMIQLQEGSGDGTPTVQQGAFLYARQYAVLKRSKFPDSIWPQNENPWFGSNQSIGADFLRYIDELWYRSFVYGPAVGGSVRTGRARDITGPRSAARGGPTRPNTPMRDYRGRRVVREPEPQKVMKTYNGYDANFKEIGPSGQMPGTTYLSTDVIP